VWRPCQFLTARRGEELTPTFPFEETTMNSLRCLAALLFVLAAAVPALADEKKDDDGFVPMFDGKTLKGWVNVNCAPGTFFVKDGQIITTGKPTGYLRTEKQYENFIAEFDWMHLPPKPGAVGNSGFFVWADPIPAIGTGYTRGIEVQVLVNLTYKNKKGAITATSQGDLFSIWGAHCKPDRPHPDGWERCLPSENHTKGENEWNHYGVLGKDGRITLTVNGHEVSGVSKCTPRKGYLALESEGSECRFKNLKIKELPSSNPKQDEIADVAEGHKSIFNGLDLEGWKADKDAWKVNDGVVRSTGNSRLVSDTGKFSNCELIFDWKLPAKSTDQLRVEIGTPERTAGSAIVQLKGTDLFVGKKFRAGMLESESGSAFATDGIKPGAWNRMIIRIADGRETITINGKEILARKGNAPPAGPISFRQAEGLELRSIFVREIKP
jgi:hypothetical protein